MFEKTKNTDLPQELLDPLTELDSILRSYLAALSFIVQDTARDPNYADNHLLFYLAQDFLESAISIGSLAIEGLLNVAKRELRFILESSIKICFVQQKSYHSSIKEKLEQFDKELSSPRISLKQNLDLSMLPEDLRELFSEDTGRIYSLMSSYVHLTPLQIEGRIAAVNAGRSAGKVTAADVEGLNSLSACGLANSLVLLLHSVPSYVAGDLLVKRDGTTIDWYFSGSRFLAGIDIHFDYKHERQAKLTEIRETRQAKIRF